MSSFNVNPVVELVNFKGEDCLKFTFNGHLTAEDAKYGVEQWREFFKSAEGQKVIIIWDSVNMTGFDFKAQLIWQHALKEMKKQIECVWLITNSNLIKAGAKLMSAFTSYCLKVVDDAKNISFSVLL